MVVCVVPVHFQSFQRMNLKKTMTTAAAVVQWAFALCLVLREFVVVVARDRMANLVPFVFFCCQFPSVVDRQFACGRQYVVRLPWE